MPIKTLTAEEQAAKDLKDKNINDLIKEGKTPEEAKAIVLAAKAESNKKQ